MEVKDDLLNEFVIEAKAHIAQMEAGLLRLEEGEGDEETINAIFRAAHSIKGTAGFFGLNKIVELSHAIESLFGEIREHRVEIKPAMVDLLLAAADALQELIVSPADSERHDIIAHVAAIKGFLGGQEAKPVKPGALSAWDLWNELTTADIKPAETPPAGIPEKPAGVPAVEVQQTGRPREIVMEDSVRVSVGLLNDLLNLAGEMVLRRNQLLRVAQDAGRLDPQLEVVSKGIDELTTNLQKKIMKTRMQPIANVFNKFPRIVRDLSRKVGKEVDLALEGMTVELDRSLIEALVDPMTHLVRNSLDHGIELPAVRTKKNKPVAGVLVLRAYHEGGRVVIDVCDDGAGINLDAVRTKALQKGLVSDKQLAAMRESDIVNFIMSPGFSTADKVTDISGRGVGLDVVKTNIEKLGGKIEIISEQGAGTTFRLILPLTLAIVSAMIVMVGGRAFLIPQANVRELLLIQPDDSTGKKVEMVHNQPVLRLRGRLLPLVQLGKVLAEELKPCSAAEDDWSVQGRKLRVLVIKSGGADYGLIVDSVYDTEEILVKPLPAVLGGCGLYSGVTVLGDGSIAMILDTDSLRLRAGLPLLDEPDRPSELRVTKSVDGEKQYLLLFKCSGGEMLGLDLAMVSRVETVPVSRLQRVGAKTYFSYQGKSIRVIRPEHYMPISRKKNNPAKVYVILPKLVKFPLGIMAEGIHEAVYTSVSLDENGVSGQGVLGSALIDGNLVTLVNMHELFAIAAPEFYKISGRDDYEARVGRKLKVLLAEDTPFFLKVVKSYLESDGYEVITAENGHEAWEILKKTAVDAVVSDIEMPLMTGIELVRAIRASEGLRHLPVIALTSLVGETNKEKGLRAGFDIYEYKLDRTRLLDKLRDLLGKRSQEMGG